MQQVTGADISFAASAGLTAATWVADLAAFMQIGATAVAILAGAMAALYHYEKWREKRKARKDSE